MDNAIGGLISLYQELNGSIVDELSSEPTSLEFMRHVARNRPFVIRGAVNHWRARRKWNVEYLTRILDGKTVKVAVTPYGNADSVVFDGTNGVNYFVKPYEKDAPFDDFISQVLGGESGSGKEEEVWYAQTQNDNLRGEYQEIFQDVEQDISWVHEALLQPPDAINMWIGNSRSTTALHRDNYENIYCQILGRKHFVLIPPLEIACVNEKFLEQATYQVDAASKLVVVADVESDPIPCALWDPDKPELETNRYSGLCKPMRVTLEPGDLLYLPALWNHKVSQSVGEEGICCAVNYWYDMDFGGSLYASSNFLREMALRENDPDGTSAQRKDSTGSQAM